MRLKDEQYEFIKQIIADTFEEFGINTIPINPLEMSIKMEIPIIPYSSFPKSTITKLENLSTDGFSKYTDNCWTIYYNDKCNNYERVRNTIMHELAHYILGHIKDGDEEENEANFFAKYALAPPPLIHKMKEEKTVENIADNFHISYTAARYALDYYRKWMQYSGIGYKNYEQKIIKLFEVA